MEASQCKSRRQILLKRPYSNNLEPRLRVTGVIADPVLNSSLRGGVWWLWWARMSHSRIAAKMQISHALIAVGRSPRSFQDISYVLIWSRVMYAFNCDIAAEYRVAALLN